MQNGALWTLVLSALAISSKASPKKRAMLNVYILIVVVEVSAVDGVLVERRDR